MAKTTWGGKREGAGRPSGEYSLRLLKVAATQQELKMIYELDTRERTTALLDAVAVKRVLEGERDGHARS